MNIRDYSLIAKTLRKIRPDKSTLHYLVWKIITLELILNLTSEDSSLSVHNFLKDAGISDD